MRFKESHKKTDRKRLLFWVVLILANLLVLEIILSVFFFQRKSENYSAIVHYLHSANKKIKKKLYEKKPIGIWERDPKFGYSHKSNSRGTHRALDWEVTYTIGTDKERFIPAPEDPLGRILFLGGSFTFGHGVDDDKTFSYVLSKKYWTKWHIVNKAVNGWGTSHAYMVLSEEIEGDNPPSMIIYFMHIAHIKRNYIRRSWVNVMEEYDRGHPHFELENGNLVFKGIVDIANSKKYSQEVKKKELELTVAFLVDMHNKCAQRQIPFVTVLIGTCWPSAIIKNLAEHNVPFLDLSGMKIEAFPNDGHPNENDHQLIAEAISQSFISEKLESFTK